MFPVIEESAISCGVEQLCDFPTGRISEKRLRTMLLKVGQDFWGDWSQEGEYVGLWPNQRYVRFDPPRYRAENELHPSCAFLLFSHKDSNKVTQRFAALIEAEKLGDVWRSEPANNPNSGNDIVVYVWKVDKANFKKWYVENRGELK